jgi:hypothetical protein
VSCLDFYSFSNLYEPITPPAASFTHGGCDFRPIAGGLPLLIHRDGGAGALHVPGQGLRFPRQGVEVTPRVMSAEATLSVGTFGQPVDVSALDAAGAVMTSVVVPSNNAYNKVSITTPTPFHSLTLTGGNNEGVLERVCLVLPVITPKWRLKRLIARVGTWIRGLVDGVRGLLRPSR